MTHPSVDELLFMFLQNASKDIVWAACGILINLTADPEQRPFLRERGLATLLDVRRSNLNALNIAVS